MGRPAEQSLRRTTEGFWEWWPLSKWTGRRRYRPGTPRASRRLKVPLPPEPSPLYPTRTWSPPQMPPPEHPSSRGIPDAQSGVEGAKTGSTGRWCWLLASWERPSLGAGLRGSRSWPLSSHSPGLPGPVAAQSRWSRAAGVWGRGPSCQSRDPACRLQRTTYTWCQMTPAGYSQEINWAFWKKRRTGTADLLTLHKITFESTSVTAEKIFLMHPSICNYTYHDHFKSRRHKKKAHIVQSACRDESSRWHPHRRGRPAPGKRAARWNDRVSLLRPPAPTARPDEEANVGINPLADMPPLLVERFVINVAATETIKWKTYNLSDGVKAWVNVQPGYWTPRTTLQSCDCRDIASILFWLLFQGVQTFRLFPHKADSWEWIFVSLFVSLCVAMSHVRHHSASNCGALNLFFNGENIKWAGAWNGRWKAEMPLRGPPLWSHSATGVGASHRRWRYLGAGRQNSKAGKRAQDNVS